MPESNTQTNNPPDPASEPELDPISVDVALNHALAICEDKIREIVLQIAFDHKWRFGEISIAVVDDETIHTLNKQYLKHDYETDVLSFVLYCDEQARMLSGEVIVSADTAATMAKQHSIEPSDELLLYIIHGMLHLVGYDDKVAQNRAEMRVAEQRYTSMFDIQYASPDGVDG